MPARTALLSAARSVGADEKDAERVEIWISANNACNDWLAPARAYELIARAKMTTTEMVVVNGFLIVSSAILRGKGNGVEKVHAT